MRSTLPAPLIVTLKLDGEAFAHVDALRHAYFPHKRNVLPAHLTLFHALPGDQEEALRHELHQRCATESVVPLRLLSLRSLGRGVAVQVEAPKLLLLRQQLATVWNDWLSPQDRQGYRPHITIQNKVAPERARRLYTELTTDWKPLVATGEGLLLWRYLNGPWELMCEECFASDRHT